jgi:hypothetical protein
VAPNQSELAPGDVILAVNGMSAPTLVERLEALAPGSPATKQFRAREEFGAVIWTLGLRPPFEVEVARHGGPTQQSLTLAGWTSADAVVRTTYGRANLIEYRRLADGLGFILFDDMTQPADRFYRRLVEIFTRVAEDRPRGLIIDIRRNSGGNSALGSLLLDFITRKDYRPFAERRWKVSRTCQDWFRVNADAEDRHFDAYLTAPPGTTLVTAVDPHPPRASALTYDGPVAALIGPGTFSSGAILADVMATYGVATLIGRPTSEPASMYAEVCEAALPNSGLRVVAPSGYFVRANGDDSVDGLVLPDVPVDGRRRDPTADPTLDAARAWLKAQPAAP